MSASNDYHETLTLKLLDSNSYDEVSRIKQNNEKEKDQIKRNIFIKRIDIWIYNKIPFTSI